jgi:hypothetical protein
MTPGKLDVIVKLNQAVRETTRNGTTVEAKNTPCPAAP